MTKKEKDDEGREAVEILVDAIFEDAKPRRKPTVNHSKFGIASNVPSDYMAFWLGMQEQLVSVSEAAKIRQTSRIAIYDLIERGRLHTVEFGGKTFLIRKEVEQFERGKPGPKSERETDND